MNLWNWLFRPKALPPAAQFPERATVALATPQARASWANQIGPLGNPFSFVPQYADLEVYERLINAVPIINAALTKTVEIIGTPRFEHADDAVEAELKEWMDRVRVNRVQHGFVNWANTWMIDHLTYGRAHAETIPSADYRDIAAIQELHPRTIVLRARDNGYDVDIVQWQVGRGEVVTLNPQTIVTALYDVRTDNPYGSSLLYGLPFTAEILAAMTKAVGDTHKRFGTPTYSAIWTPPDTLNDPEGAVGDAVVSRLLAMLRDVQVRRLNGDVADFAFAGNVKLDIMGANGEELDYTAPARTITEQIVAKLGLPPMMLGLQWQAGERIGAVQAGLLSARIDAMRAALEAELLYVVQLRQALAGNPTDVTLCWEAPTLMDAMESAEAELAQARAEHQEQLNDAELWRNGVINNAEYARRHREDLAELNDEEVLAMLPDLATEAPAPPAPSGFGGGFGGGMSPQMARSLTYSNDRRNGHES